MGQGRSKRAGEPDIELNEQKLDKEELEEEQALFSSYLPTSGAATSLTREANWSLSL